MKKNTVKFISIGVKRHHSKLAFESGILSREKRYGHLIQELEYSSTLAKVEQIYRLSGCSSEQVSCVSSTYPAAGAAEPIGGTWNGGA